MRVVLTRSDLKSTKKNRQKKNVDFEIKKEYKNKLTKFLPNQPKVHSVGTTTRLKGF